MATADTKERLLDAAEKLFCEGGIGVTSLRAITQLAGTNLASVNYHFGSKLELVKAVFDRRLDPLNGKRLQLLEQTMAESTEPALESILEALVVPTVEMLQESADAGSDFPRLVGRAQFEPDPALRRLVVETFEGVTRRFTTALGTCLPDLSEQEIFARFFFALGAMLIFTDIKMLTAFSGDVENVDLELPTLVGELVWFLAAGFRSDAYPGEPEARP